MQNVSTVRPQSGLFAGLFADYAEARVEQFRRKHFAKTVRELERLSDQQLSDIGVPRDEIKQRAYDSVYHQKPYKQ
ncbi:MAG: DUF1127 domain-containing protein [Ruegeria sp.]